jgi:drug/metabolite transporter (DMT)-like permease
MVRVIVRALLGVIVIGFIIASNRQIFRGVRYGPRLSGLEWAYYVFGLTTVVLGSYFALQFMSQHSHSGNPLWGAGSWTDYRRMMFDGPAGSAAGQDLMVANFVLLPLVTIIGGFRRGVRRPWLYVLASVFTSFAFAWAFYLATAERQRRVAAGSVESEFI